MLISIFSSYKVENDAHYAKAFDFDWNCSRLEKFLKDPEEIQKVKKILRENYKYFKAGYKQYSSLSGLEVFAVPMNNFTEFINSLGILQKPTLKLSDVDITFIATGSGKR